MNTSSGDISEKPEISLVIPVFNEAKNLVPFTAAISSVLKDISAYEILFIDDGSTDSSWLEIMTIAQTQQNVRGYQLSRNFGKEAALWLGLEQSLGAAIIVMDADLQHPASLLPDMITAWREKKGAVIDAVKNHRGDESLFYKAASLLFYQSFTRLTGMNLQNSSDFKLLDRKVVESILSFDERVTFFRGVTSWVGFTHFQIPFEVARRTEGRSGWSSIKLVRFFIESIVSFTSLPLQAVSLMGFFFMFAAGFLLLQTLWNYFLGHAIEGFTTVIIVQLLIGSCILVGLGTVGLYLATMFQELKKRPRYFVSQTTHHDSSDRP